MASVNNFSENIISIAVMVLCSVNVANAVEKDKFYVSGRYGAGFADKFDYRNPKLLDARKPSSASVFGLSVGYGVTDNVRAELTYNCSYDMKYKSVANLPSRFDSRSLEQRIFSTKQKANTLFISSFYDIKVNKLKNITPYIGFGIGLSQSKSGDMKVKQDFYSTVGQLIESVESTQCRSKKNNSFAWHVSAGVNYAFNDKIDLNLVDYKYANLRKAKTLVNQNDEVVTNQLKLHIINTGATYKF